MPQQQKNENKFGLRLRIDKDKVRALVATE